MEPTEGKITYIIPTTVVKSEEKTRLIWISGTKESAKFRTESLGWFVQFTGSQESIRLGDTEPALKPGDRVRITITKEPDDALPSQPPLK